MEKVGFKDLTLSLKIIVVFCWVWMSLFTIGFVIGFIEAFFGLV